MLKILKLATPSVVVGSIVSSLGATYIIAATDLTNLTTFNKDIADSMVTNFVNILGAMIPAIVVMFILKRLFSHFH